MTTLTEFTLATMCYDLPSYNYLISSQLKCMLTESIPPVKATGPGTTKNVGQLSDVAIGIDSSLRMWSGSFPPGILKKKNPLRLNVRVIANTG